MFNNSQTVMDPFFGGVKNTLRTDDWLENSSVARAREREAPPFFTSFTFFSGPFLSLWSLPVREIEEIEKMKKDKKEGLSPAFCWHCGLNFLHKRD